jgi:hypothetical protein
MAPEIIPWRLATSVDGSQANWQNELKGDLHAKIQEQNMNIVNSARKTPENRYLGAKPGHGGTQLQGAATTSVRFNFRIVLAYCPFLRRQKLHASQFRKLFASSNPELSIATRGPN